MRFTKLQALGNDYICVDATRRVPAADLPALARRLTHRRLGVGGDGLLCVFSLNLGKNGGQSGPCRTENGALWPLLPKKGART